MGNRILVTTRSRAVFGHDLSGNTIGNAFRHRSRSHDRAGTPRKSIAARHRITSGSRSLNGYPARNWTAVGPGPGRDILGHANVKTTRALAARGSPCGA